MSVEHLCETLRALRKSA